MIVAARRSPRISISKRTRAACRRQRDGHVALRQRAVHVVAVAAGGDPADDLAVVPDGLVAEHIGIASIDHEGDAA